MVPQGWSWGGETEYERVWNRGRCMCACFLACLISRMCVFTSACMWLSRCACAWLSAMSVMYHMNVSAYLCVFLHLPISLWGHLLWTPASHLNFPSHMSVLLPLLYLRGQHDRRQHKLQIPTVVCPMWCVLLIAGCVYRWMWLCVFLSIW